MQFGMRHNKILEGIKFYFDKPEKKKNTRWDGA